MEEISKEKFLSQPSYPRPRFPQPHQSSCAHPSPQISHIGSAHHPPQTSQVSASPHPQTLTAQYLRTLTASISGHAASATFACGGSIPLSPWSSHGSYSQPVEAQKEKVTLRWDSSPSSLPAGSASASVPERLYGKKLSFPLRETDDDADTLAGLIADCQPATFGLNGRDVLDEQYRRAAKMDKERFCTDFHPADCGILEAVGRVLGAGVPGDEGRGLGERGVRGEIYKLNIYSGPSGIFQPHVDTPRGEGQFGSLVVCLPVSHQGGALLVTHRGQTATFDWSSSSSRSDSDPSIQWAAFYGDCTHQVLQVTAGHRITLTYNLYFSSLGALAQPVADPARLALYKPVRDMLAQPAFMRKGGVLGFFCHHAYAHSSESGRTGLPGGLKGVDLTVFAVFAALGVRVRVVPVVRKPPDGCWGGLRVREVPPREDLVRVRGDRYEPRMPIPHYDEEYEGVEEEKVEEKDDGDTIIVDSDENTMDEEDARYFSPTPECEDSDRVIPGSIVGTSLHGAVFAADLEDEGWHALEKLNTADHWPHELMPEIHWMNDPAHEEFAFAHIAYGNQAELEWKFSAAAILVDIPASEERRSPGGFGGGE